MAIEFCGFFDSSQDDVREYSAASFTEYFSSFVHNGVYSDGDNLKVYADGTGMKVCVKIGKGWINGYYYALKVENADDVLELPLAAADPTLSRIDRVVLRLDTSAAMRNMYLAVVTGVAAASPVAPELTHMGDVYELGLATVTVAANTASIAASAVMDTRSDTDVCGIYNAFGIVSNDNRRAELCRFTTSGTFNPADYPTADGLYDVFIVGGGQAGAFSSSNVSGGLGGYARMLEEMSINITTAVTIGAGGKTSSQVGGTTSFGAHNAPGGGGAAEAGVNYTKYNKHNGLYYGMWGGNSDNHNGAGPLGGAGGFEYNESIRNGGEGCGGGGLTYNGSNSFHGGNGGIGGGGGGGCTNTYSTSWGGCGIGGDGIVIIYGHKIDGYNYPEVVAA